MKRIIAFLLFATIAYAATNDLRMERQRADGSFDPVLFAPMNGRVLMTDGAGNIVYENSRAPTTVTRTPAASPTSFQPSATRDSTVSYTVQIASVITLTGTAGGSVFLEVSPDNVTFTEISRAVNSQTGGVVVGVSLTQTIAFPLSGYVPPGYYVRLRTSSSVTGTGASVTFSYLSGQETLL